MKIIRCAACGVALFVFAISAWSAEKPVTDNPSVSARKTAQKAPAKPAANLPRKSPSKPIAKGSRKPAPKSSVRITHKGIGHTQKGVHKTALDRNPANARSSSLPLKGKTEILTCRNGTEDRHARIAVVLIGGKTDSFAYYSKWKPRTCSIHLQRQRDAYSKWTDKGKVTNVNLEHGLFLIEHGKGEYRFVFRDIDRERYCGMDGTINGTLTIRKGSERCEVAGIMEEGVPLGQAYANLDQLPAPAAGSESTPEATPVREPQVRPAGQTARRPSQSAFPSSASE
jgi:hypothetical protein